MSNLKFEGSTYIDNRDSAETISYQADRITALVREVAKLRDAEIQWKNTVTTLQYTIRDLREQLAIKGDQR